MHNRKFLSVTALFCALILPCAAFAQGGAYFGGGYSLVTYDQTGLGDADPTAAVSRFGFHFTENLALEGRLGFGLSGGDQSVSGGTVEYKVEQISGAYLVGHLPLAETASLYGLAGVTRVELSRSLRNLNLTGDQENSGFSYGAGIQIDLTQRISGYLEWVQYLDRSDYDVSALTIGAAYYF